MTTTTSVTNDPPIDVASKVQIEGKENTNIQSIGQTILPKTEEDRPSPRQLSDRRISDVDLDDCPFVLTLIRIVCCVVCWPCLPCYICVRCYQWKETKRPSKK